MSDFVEFVKETFVFALTGWGRKEDHARTTACGFDAHLVKPVDPIALEKLLAESWASHHGSVAAFPTGNPVEAVRS